MACSAKKTAVAEYPIEEEITLMAERAFYVVEGLKSLLASFTRDTEFPINMFRFNTLRNEYLEAYQELAVTLRKIYHTVLPPSYLSAEFEQEVNFELNKIVVYSTH